MWSPGWLARPNRPGPARGHGTATPRGAQFDGNGNWTISGSNWWNGGNDQLWNNANSDTAQFGYLGGDTTQYTVTLGTTPITVGGIIFQDQAYTLSGGTLEPRGSSPTITTNAPSATIGSVIAGTSTLTTAGTGTLTLSGNNTFTGGSILAAGVINLGVAENLARPARWGPRQRSRSREALFNTRR